MPITDATKCSATTKSSGQPCTQPAVRGSNVCRLHGGGNVNRGKRGGRPIKHGRYSSRLPERLASKYQEALSDSKLLELRDEVALLDSRLQELLGCIDSGESGARWKAVKAAHDDVRQAIHQHDSSALNVALVALAATIEGGLMEQLVWAEIMALVDARRRLVESERRRYVEMSQMITSERAMILLARIVDIIRSHVHEPTTLQSISTSIRALVSHGDGGQFDPAD